MTDFAGKRPDTASGHRSAATAGPTPGKRSLTEQLPQIAPSTPVQRAESGRPGAAGGDTGEQNTAAVHASAQRGIATPASPLPHLDTLQRAFGHHDVSGIQAHTGDGAADSARGMGAQAYATGNHVVLGGGTDLHTVAHEAAHVVQQRGGVQLKGGVGEAGDPFERHADAVADSVVRGESAEALLDVHAGQGSASGTAVQRYSKLTQAASSDASGPSSGAGAGPVVGRLSNNRNLLVIGQDAYATREVIAASEQKLATSGGRVALAAGTPLAAAAYPGVPEGLFQVVVSIRTNNSGQPETTAGGALGGAAARFNAADTGKGKTKDKAPEEGARHATYTAEVTSRLAELEKMIGKVAELEAELRRAEQPAEAEPSLQTTQPPPVQQPQMLPHPHPGPPELQGGATTGCLSCFDGLLAYWRTFIQRLIAGRASTRGSAATNNVPMGAAARLGAIDGERQREMDKKIDKPSFDKDFSALGPIATRAETTDLEKFTETLGYLRSIRDSYQRDLASDKLVVPGDCRQCAQYISGNATDNSGDAAPEVGTSLTVSFNSMQADRGWEYHYAAPVLQDGDDIVTLETAAEPDLPKLTRTNWQFQMYGTETQNFWAESWAEYATSMEKRGENLSPQDQETLAAARTDATSLGKPKAGSGEPSSNGS